MEGRKNEERRRMEGRADEGNKEMEGKRDEEGEGWREGGMKGRERDGGKER